MKNKSKAYWQKRFLAVEQRTHDAAVDYLQDLAKAYEQADAYLRRDIELWYARFAANNELDLAAAKKLLDNDELKEFKWTVEEYIEKGKTLEYSKQWAKELENASAKVHINRAEALRIQLRQRAAEIYAKIDQEMPILMQAQYKDAYLGTAFEVAQGSGAEVTIDLARIDDAALAKVIKKPWSMDGQTFSSRIWTNQAQLIVNLQKSLMTSLITGANKDDMIRRIAKDFKTDLYKAARLVHTESAVMAAMADKDMYEDLGTEEFEVLETLDMKTCEVCGDMDGKHFPLKDYEIGVTAPPFHPNCRGTTVPYIDEEELAEIDDDEPYPWGTRAARDPETGKTIQVPGNMTYKEWREKIVKDIGQDEWDVRKKMIKNEASDKEQFKAYVDQLGKEGLPKTFDEFQALKYRNHDEWNLLKGYKREVDKNNLSPLVGFDHFRAMHTKLENTFVGKTTSDNVVINSVKPHFTARIIGTHEWRFEPVQNEELRHLLNHQSVPIDVALKALESNDIKESMKKQKDGTIKCSRTYSTEKCMVTINPNDGSLIQTNWR